MGEDAKLLRCDGGSGIILGSIPNSASLGKETIDLDDRPLPEPP
jgi:hypothetical protein